MKIKKLIYLAAPIAIVLLAIVFVKLTSKRYYEDVEYTLNTPGILMTVFS